MGNRGSAPGERRGGRAKNTPNKVTAELAVLTRKHTPLVLKELLRIAKQSPLDETRLKAIDMILDRGYGKPTQDFMMRGAGDDGSIPVDHRFPDLAGMEVDDLVKLYRGIVSER